MPNKIVIDFTIKGNNINADGNAFPKLKMTGNQFWTEKAQRYVGWKSFVLASVLDQTKDHPAKAMIVRNIGLVKKPFTTSEDCRARMDISILWADRKHGDAENVFGSIADSLFKQDKWLDGSFKSEMSKNKQGSVDVSITLFCSQ